MLFSSAFDSVIKKKGRTSYGYWVRTLCALRTTLALLDSASCLRFWSIAMLTWLLHRFAADLSAGLSFCESFILPHLKWLLDSWSQLETVCALWHDARYHAGGSLYIIALYTQSDSNKWCGSAELNRYINVHVKHQHDYTNMLIKYSPDNDRVCSFIKKKEGMKNVSSGWEHGEFSLVFFYLHQITQ